MAFRQYTQCVDIAYFDKRSPYVQATLLGFYVTLTPAGFAALLAIAGAAAPRCLWLLLEIYVMAWIVGFCYWWLYRRLICISSADHPADSAGDHLAIGLLINIEPPGSGSFIDNIDNDYSIGILPCPLPLGANRAQVVQNSPFGYLIDGDSWAMNNGLPFAGEQALCPGHPQSDKSEVLHCEFEGRGMYDLYLAAQAALFLAVAALFACLIDTPVGMIIAIILAILSGLALVVGWIVGQFDAGDPSDINPNVGELTQCTDVLMIKGHWVYDSLHTGAFELHPVTFCCKANCDSENVILLRDRWQGAINDATSAATLASQKQPQNQWQVHPLIDGCQPSGIIV
jgi:hypothetical protein